jgi:hypothetical protein
VLLKFGFLSGVGVAASLLALYWVQPETNGGQALLALIVFAVVNGIGGLVWRRKE